MYGSEKHDIDVSVTHSVLEVAVLDRQFGGWCSLAACVLGSAPPVAPPPALETSWHRSKSAFQFGMRQDSVAKVTGHILQSASSCCHSHPHKTGRDAIVPLRRSL